MDAATADRVRELNLKGVYFQKEFKRFYPNNDLAAQVLGYVGTDDTGLGGLEQQFDDDMHGELRAHADGGRCQAPRDGQRDENEPMPGENLVLTIDANIQYMAERALDAQMAKMKALHGTVVVQDPHTGQILALAISPRFNPERLAPHGAGLADESGGERYLRAGFDLQAGDLLGGDRCARASSRRTWWTARAAR